MTLGVAIFVVRLALLRRLVRARSAALVAAYGPLRQRLQQAVRLAQLHADGVVAQRRPAPAPGASRSRAARARGRTPGRRPTRRAPCRTSACRNRRRGPRSVQCCSPHCISACTAGHSSRPRCGERAARAARRARRCPCSSSVASRAASIALRDVEAPLEVVEAADAEQEVADDQQRPALADDLERPRHRAGLARVVASERHGRDCISSMVELLVVGCAADAATWRTTSVVDRRRLPDRADHVRRTRTSFGLFTDAAVARCAAGTARRSRSRSRCRTCCGGSASRSPARSPTASARGACWRSAACVYAAGVALMAAEHERDGARR